MPKFKCLSHCSSDFSGCGEFQPTARVDKQDPWAWGTERRDLGPSFRARSPGRVQVPAMLPRGTSLISRRPKECHQGPGHLVQQP